MAEIGISIAAKVAEYAVVPLLRPVICYAVYLFCDNKIKRNLEATKAELKSKEQNVLKRKEEARNRNENTVEDVEEWLNKVSRVMEEVGQLEEQMKEGSSCCWGWCSTLKGYRLCKKFAKITDSMKHLNQIGEFNPFSQPIPIQDVEFFSSENFVCFESTKSASKQLLEALQDDSVCMIGLHGMGGCGKTTLAKEVDDVWSSFKLAEDVGIPLYNNCKGCKVLLTTRLQQVCALMGCEKKIQLSLLSYEEAYHLFQRNTPIADEFMAQEIVKECRGLAIAIVAVAKSLKVRSLDWWNVALHKLRNSKPFNVRKEERDAYSCLELSYNYLQSDEARLLLKICCMFPEDYKIPLEELFRYGIGLGMCEEIDSFDLARRMVSAAVEDLIDSSLLLPCQNENYRGEKYFNIHDVVRDVTLWIASKEDNIIMVDPERGFNAITENESLKDCYALSLWHKRIDQFPQYLDGPKVQFVLLNLLHELDISDASFEGMKELKVMSVIHNDIEFPKAMLSLPSSTHLFNNLHTLRLVKQKIGDISFVENLRRLTILDLAGSIFKKLPHGIADMNCELKLMDLSDCKIEEEEDCSQVIGRCSQLQELYMPLGIALPYEYFMPDSFRKLQRYRLNICNHNFEQYSKFQFDCAIDRATEYRVVSLGNMNISNLCPTVGDLLKRASSVFVDGLVGGCKSIIPDFVQVFGRTNELTKLYLSSCSEIECVIDTTTFDIADSFRLDAKFPMLVKLHIHNMGNLKDIIRGHLSLCCAFDKLKYLSIVDCPKLTSLFRSSVAQSLRQLEYLVVRNCYELKHIIVKEENEIDADEMEILPNLKHINIDGCIHLEYVFPISVARTLSSLDYIKICGCRQLKHIIRKNEDCRNQSSSQPYFPKLTEFRVIHCNELKCLFSVSFAEGLEEIMTENEEPHNQSSSQPYFPKLRELTVIGCNKLKSLFSLSIAVQLSQLERLHISYAAQLEQAFGFKNKDVSCNTDKIMLPNLSELRLEMLPNFVDICPGLKVHAAKLRGMVLVKCPKLDSIHQWNTQVQVINDRQVCNKVSYLDTSFSEEEPEKIITPILEFLYFKDLRDLMFIWKGATLINFGNLVDLCVVACGKLKFIFPACAVISLPTLKSLIIKDCEELEQIFGYASEKRDYNRKVIELALPKLTNLQLFRLPRFTSFGGDLQFQLKFQVLKRYKVQDCPKISSTTLETLENLLLGLEGHNSGDDYHNYLDFGRDMFNLVVRMHFEGLNETTPIRLIFHILMVHLLRKNKRRSSLQNLHGWICDDYDNYIHDILDLPVRFSCNLMVSVEFEDASSKEESNDASFVNNMESTSKEEAITNGKASIGQVYKGRLKENGDVVAVKVQSFVLETVSIDVAGLVDESAARFFEELDYVNEG
ncbi:hypothetical protein L6164_016568 [Bauhinia variegata]|uniref:Uncharacterized protein n=1 Tax=Bauhinia variegata TaxID=167791 RepID=A0ACB9NRK2_BAUVA|nr:hypothetical protein L6164_016568 [Bauhinia variegata]